MISPIEDMWSYLKTNHLSGITVSGCTSNTAVNGVYCTDIIAPSSGNIFLHSIENKYNIIYTTKYQLRNATTVLAESTTLLGTYTNKTGTTGSIVVAKSPCWWGIRQGDDNQSVVMGRGVGDEIIETYKRYYVDIHVYDTNFRGAEDRALSLADAMGTLRGTQTGAPGWSGSAWTAVALQVDYRGVIETLKITGSVLYDAVVSITLTQLRRN